MKTIYILLLMLLPILGFGQNNLYDFKANPLPDRLTYFHIDEKVENVTWMYKKETQAELLSNNIFLPSIKQHYTNEYKHLIEDKGVKLFYLDIKIGRQYFIDNYFKSGDESYLYDIDLDTSYFIKLRILRPYVTAGKIKVRCYQDYFYYDDWTMIRDMIGIAYHKHLKGLKGTSIYDMLDINYFFDKRYSDIEERKNNSIDLIDDNDPDYLNKINVIEQIAEEKTYEIDYYKRAFPAIIRWEYFNKLNNAFWGKTRINHEELMALKNDIDTNAKLNAALKKFYGNDYRYIEYILNRYPYAEDMKLLTKNKHRDIFYDIRVNTINNLITKDSTTKKFIEIQDNKFAGLCSCKKLAKPHQQETLLQLSALAKNSYWMQTAFNSGEWNNLMIPEDYNNKIGYYMFTNTTAPVLYFLLKYD